MTDDRLIREHDVLEIDVPGKGTARFTKENRSTSWNVGNLQFQAGLNDVLAAMYEGKALAVRAFVEQTVVRTIPRKEAP